MGLQTVSVWKEHARKFPGGALRRESESSTGAKSMKGETGLRRDFLAALRCPYTGDGLDAAEQLAGSDRHMLFGIVRSEAGEFPVIDGITRLLIDELRAPLVDLLRRGRPRDALKVALDVPFYDRGGSAINFATRLVYPRGAGVARWCADRVKRHVYRILTDSTASFTDTVRRLWSPRWAEWQINRFAMPTFLPQFALATLTMSDSPVLDFGSGVGHGTFLLSRESPSRLVCADYSFSSLYLARKYFVPDAEFVCLDGDFPLPFASGYFGTVYSSDTLHCLDSKVLLANEFKRVLQSSGRIVLPHLHNAKSSVRFGKSLSARGYASLFEGLRHRIVPEEEVVRDLVDHGVLDLDRTYAAAALDKAVNGFCLVAAYDAGVLRRYTGLWEHRLSRLQAPMLNPIYEVKRNGKECAVTRRRLLNPGPALPDTDVLPDSAVIPLEDMNGQALRRLAAADPVCYGELVRKLIVVDGPARFG